MMAAEVLGLPRDDGPHHRRRHRLHRLHPCSPAAAAPPSPPAWRRPRRPRKIVADLQAPRRAALGRPGRGGRVEVAGSGGVSRRRRSGKPDMPLATLAAQSAPHRRPDRAPRSRSTPKARVRGSASHLCDVEVDPETGHVTDPALHRRPGRRHGPSTQAYVEGQIQGGVGPGHRLGVERGIHLRQRQRPGWRTPASSTIACRSPRTCR